MTVPTEWVSSPEYPGYRMKVIQYNGCTIEIFRPELSEEEQAKREAHTTAVAERVLRDYYKRKEQTS